MNWFSTLPCEIWNFIPVLSTYAENFKAVWASVTKFWFQRRPLERTYWNWMDAQASPRIGGLFDSKKTTSHQSSCSLAWTNSLKKWTRILFYRSFPSSSKPIRNLLRTTFDETFPIIHFRDRMRLDWVFYEHILQKPGSYSILNLNDDDSKASDLAVYVVDRSTGTILSTLVTGQSE